MHESPDRAMLREKLVTTSLLPEFTGLTFWTVFKMWYCSIFCRAALLDSLNSSCTVMPLALVNVGSLLSHASLVGAKIVTASELSFR